MWQPPRRQVAAGSTTPPAVLSMLCPLLKVFSGGDPTAPRNRAWEVASSGLASIARMPYGTSVRQDLLDIAPRPANLAPLVLYEFEACPFCRRVRETLSELDLVAEVRPCPKESVVHRAEVLKMGGREQFPFLVDPNTPDGCEGMYESGDIVEYLYAQYGGGKENVPPGFLQSTLLTGWMPTLLRAGRGMTRHGTRAPSDPALKLELWNYEGNQFARLVREALCELELPYVLKNAGKGSPRRAELVELTGGSTTIPYLVDLNGAGKRIQDSEEAVRYLFDMYSS